MTYMPITPQRVLLSRRNIELHNKLEEQGLVVSRNNDIYGSGITESLTVSVPLPDPGEDSNKD